MAPSTVAVSVVDKLERRKSGTSGLQECHLHCVDKTGKDVTIVFPEREVARLFSILNVYVKR
ncbi:MAG TPA: hypothetical protein VF943_16970 [Burkholderiales bacterium]